MDIKEKARQYKWWIIIGFAILIGVIVFFAASCGGGPSSPGGPGPRGGDVSDVVKKVWEKSSGRIPLAKDVRQVTPKGAAVYSRAGLSQEHLNQVDEALTELFADVEAGFPGQTTEKAKSYWAYEIYEPDHDCIPAPESGTPSFYVKDGSLAYDGSQWDQYDGKDGKSVVLAPERVFGMTTAGSTITIGGSTKPSPCMMLICPDLGAWRNAVRYGAEHNISESACDLQINPDGTRNPANALCQLAGANRTHTTGGHPFIPSRAAGLKAPTKANWSEFAPISPIDK